MADRDDHPTHVRNVSNEPLPVERAELSVMDWLLGIGHVVARRMRGVPRAPMVSVHPKH